MPKLTSSPVQFDNETFQPYVTVVVDGQDTGIKMNLEVVKDDAEFYGEELMKIALIEALEVELRAQGFGVTKSDIEELFTDM